MPVLVLAEHDTHMCKDTTLPTVMAACHISMYFDGQIHVLVVGHQMRAVQEQVASINGVSKVLVADAPHLASGMRDNIAAQLIAVVRAGNYSHILFAASKTGRNAARDLADRLGVAAIGDIRRVLSSHTFECDEQAGKGKGKSPFNAATQILTVCTTAFEAAQAEGGIGPIEWLQPVPAMAPCKETTSWHFSECVSRKFAHMRPSTAIWPSFAT